MAGRTSINPTGLSVRNPGTGPRGCRDTVRAMSESPLRVDRRDDGVVVLTLALPDRRNAMTGELTEAWGKTIAGMRGDRSVRCIVVTGEGSAFCAGGDIRALWESSKANGDLGKILWREEYVLNARIKKFAGEVHAGDILARIPREGVAIVVQAFSLPSAMQAESLHHDD